MRAALPQAVTNLRAFELVGKDSRARSTLFKKSPNFNLDQTLTSIRLAPPLKRLVYYSSNID